MTGGNESFKRHMVLFCILYPLGVTYISGGRGLEPRPPSDQFSNGNLLDEFLLDALSDRNALILAVLPCEILLFARSIDAFLARSLLAGSELAADASCSFFERIETHEELGIYDEEEVAETEHLVAPIRIFPAELLHIRPAGERSGEDLDYGREAVALVASGGFAEAAYGEQRALSGSELCWSRSQS